jgi:NAD(P)-dependent dehydrogenase (short-subunit alcohol dehydrogenase family)
MQLGQGIAAIVTGGASGLGAATARALAARGVKVAVLDVNEAEGAKLAAAIGGRSLACDITDARGLSAALDAARGAHGQERILVNCAGVAIGKRTARRVKETGAIEAHDLASFAKVVTVNLVGTFNAIARCAAGMMDAEPLGADGERGVIINTASVAAEDGQIGQVAYAASKGGVAAMTLPVARDLAREGIRVCAILPGLFRTPMFETSLTPEQQAALGAQVPFPSRLGDPAEYAALALHICENAMLNGVNIRLDGAIRLAPR